MENIRLVQTEDGSSSLLNVTLNETYHSTHGAIRESTHVFINSGLQFYINKIKPTSVSVFEVGFGTGLNALLALKFSDENKVKVDYAAIEAFPIEWALASRLNYSAQLTTVLKSEYFAMLHQSGWSEYVKVSENFSLFKLKETMQNFKPRSEQYDIIFFDAFAPSKQPEMWKLSVLEKIVDAMKSGGIFVTYCAKGQLKRDLKSLHMIVESLPGPPGKREMVRASKQ